MSLTDQVSSRKQLRLGVVGSGMIAGVIAKAAAASESVVLAGVASRRVASARAFADEHGIHAVFGQWQDMVASQDIDAVYVATPTSVKEAIAIQAARAGKHLLVDKPFDGFMSVRRMMEAASKNRVALMDATHFTHHPRTNQIRNELLHTIGHPLAIRASFFVPVADRRNIRFDANKEPTGVVGDLGWYAMRAVVEYLDPVDDIAAVTGRVDRDTETGAVVRAAGMVGFTDGKTATFDVGYNAGALLMDLDIIGRNGVITLDDFVLDWKSGLAQEYPSHTVGYSRRLGIQHPSEAEFVRADSAMPQAVCMLENLAVLAASPTGERARASATRALRTQQFVDAFWSEVASLKI